MDIWSLIEVERQLEGKTLEEFKQWIKDEIDKEDKEFTKWHKQEEKTKTRRNK